MARKNSRKSYLFSFVLFFLLLTPLLVEANPFLGTETAETETKIEPRVRRAPPPYALLRGQSLASQKLGDFLYTVGESPSPLQVASILGIAFLYGILHALGPGHRKAIVFSLYLSRKAPVWEPPLVGTVLAFLHGATSIAVYLLFRQISGLLSGLAETVTFYMEALTYYLLIGVGVWLLLHTLKDLRAHSPKDVQGSGLCNSSQASCIFPSHTTPRSSSTQVQALSLGALLLSGVYPCPGAFLILLLAGTLNRVGLGILAVASMSLGSGLILIFFAYLGWIGRETLFKRFLCSTSSLERFPVYIQIGGYILFILFSVYLALPYMRVMVEMVQFIGFN